MALEAPPPTILRFGVFEMDARAGELRKHGVRIKLQGQPFHVLTLLLQRPGEVVSREELRSQIWGSDTFFDFDNGLNTSINKLREALGDSADTPRFIETMPRRGYRFIAPVERLDDTGRSAERISRQGHTVVTNRNSPRRKSFLAASGVALVAALALAIWLAFFRTKADVIDSLAVLPLASDNSDPGAEYLSDGITESLINNLSQIPNLRVMARSTVFRYKGNDADPQKAGNGLHVHAVLSGRLLQHGDTLIVRTELMDVRTGAQLWGGQFNRKMGDVLALQADLSKEIAERLKLRLTGEERQLLAKRYTVDAEAYQSFLKGRYYRNKRSQEGTQK